MISDWFAEPRPKLVVLDLDQTVWPFDAAEPRYGLPHQSTATLGGVLCQGGEARAFSEAADVIRALRHGSDGAGRGFAMAVASCNSRKEVCLSLLTKFGFMRDGGASCGGIDENLVEIYPGSKRTHFQRIFATCRVPYTDMLFFDDRGSNVRVSQGFGVVGHQVSPTQGLTREAFAAGLEAWRAQRRSRGALSSWLRPAPTEVCQPGTKLDRGRVVDISDDDQAPEGNGMAMPSLVGTLEDCNQGAEMVETIHVD